MLFGFFVLSVGFFLDMGACATGKEQFFLSQFCIATEIIQTHRINTTNLTKIESYADQFLTSNHVESD